MEKKTILSKCMEAEMRFDDLEVYRLAMKIGDEVWAVVHQWNRFPRNGLGRQLTSASDSIAANISEGFGRYHYGENKHFCYFARGSLFETKTRLTKAYRRSLIDPSAFKALMTDLDTLSIKLNRHIDAIGKSPNLPRP
ncbi:four helix bundle protein [Rhodocaloribacter sp.]